MLKEPLATVRLVERVVGGETRVVLAEVLVDEATRALTTVARPLRLYQLTTRDEIRGYVAELASAVANDVLTDVSFD